MPLSTAIVIPTRDRPELLHRLLTALDALQPPPGPLEVVIADTGAESGAESGAAHPVRLPEGFSWPARVLREPSGWRSRGLNLAIAETSADVIIVFDDDVVPDPGCVRAYVEAAGRYGAGWFFGGPHVGVDEAQRPVGDPGPWRDILPRSVRGFDLGAAEVTVRDTRFLGFNMAAFRQDLLRAGGFPDYLGPNPEFPVAACETVCLRRLRSRRLWGVFLPAARVTHFVPPANRTLAFALARARMTGRGLALAEAFEPPQADPPRPLAEMRGAALAGFRWIGAAAALRPRARRLRLRYEFHRALGRVQGARRARRGAEACGPARADSA